MKKQMIIIVSVVVSVVLIIAAVFGFTRMNSSKVIAEVVKVELIAIENYNSNSSEGYITGDMSQNVYISDRLVQEVFVSEGDSVKIGDPLLQYDSTLLELDVETKELEIQGIDLEIQAANQEITSLKKKLATAVSGNIRNNDRYLRTTGEGEGEGEVPDPEPPATEPPQFEAFEWLDYNTAPEAENNGIYEYSCTEETVITRSFIHKIRGYDESGTIQIGEPMIVLLKIVGGSNWLTLNGAYVEAPGESAVDTPLYAFRANHGNLVEPDPDEEFPDFPGSFDPGPTGPVYTKDEINKQITQKEQQISKLQLDKKKAQMDYDVLKKSLDTAVVTSTVNGTVKSVGNPEEGAAMDGSPFIVVDSQEGLYLTGTISELMLDKVEVGQPVNISSWMSGLQFTAVITEISNFPASDNSYWDSNPNVSHYPFTAYIEDTAGLNNHEYVDVSVDESASGGSNFYVYKPYIRQEQGQYYVLKENEDGVLEKQYIQVGGMLWEDYYEIRSGLSREDKIAFPYGKTAKEGAKTKDMDINSIYIY